MRIIVAFPMKDRQTGLFIKKAFRSLGHEVDHCDAKTEPNNLFIRCQRYKPDFVFCSRTPRLLIEIEKIKRELPETITACWNVDKRDSVQQFKKEFGVELFGLFNEVDILYTIAKGNMSEYRQLFPNTDIKHLQEACVPSIHKPVEKKQHFYDVTFIGSYRSKVHPGRIELFNYLKREGININFFGHEREVYDDDHNEIVSLSKINLGHNGWPNVELSMGLRNYKVMSAGGFNLTQHCEGINDWFENSIATYKTPQECAEKIKYYLNNGAIEATILAEKGMYLVSKFHTVTKRMGEVIKDVITRKTANRKNP